MFSSEGSPIKRQCELAEVNRSSVYRHRNQEQTNPGHGESQENLDIMQIIDRIHLERPSWGYRKMTDYLRHNCGYDINRKRVRPYLQRNLTIDHKDQLLGIDITYLPFPKGFLYLFIIIDWYTREIVDYEISYSLEKEFVLRCLRRAHCRRKPEIINSDYTEFGIIAIGVASLPVVRFVKVWPDTVRFRA